jgi:hypothetical protein
MIMAMDLEGDISCTHCNVQEGVTKRTVHVAFNFPLQLHPLESDNCLQTFSLET